MAVTTASAEVRLEDVHRYSLDAYHRLIDLGAFDEDERVELIGGLIVRMSPKTPKHENVVRWLNRWLVKGVDDATHEVGPGCALTLADSEPEPDFVVLERGTPRPYHPATAALAIEVSVSSLRRDLRVKAPLYAAAGVSEYWVVDVDGGRVVVHRDPRADGYARRVELSAGDRLAAAAVKLPELDVADLLRAAAGT